jgi:hypothetical protein
LEKVAKKRCPAIILQGSPFHLLQKMAGRRRSGIACFTQQNHEEHENFRQVPHFQRLDAPRVWRDAGARPRDPAGGQLRKLLRRMLRPLLLCARQPQVLLQLPAGLLVINGKGCAFMKPYSPRCERPVRQGWPFLFFRVRKIWEIPKKTRKKSFTAIFLQGSPFHLLQKMAGWRRSGIACFIQQNHKEHENFRQVPHFQRFDAPRVWRVAGTGPRY